MENTKVETTDKQALNKAYIISNYINKADDYLDANFNTQGGNYKLRAIGNKQAQQLAKIYCDAYEQALKDNGL